MNRYHRYRGATTRGSTLTEMSVTLTIIAVLLAATFSVYKYRDAGGKQSIWLGLRQVAGAVSGQDRALDYILGLFNPNTLLLINGAPWIDDTGNGNRVDVQLLGVLLAENVIEGASFWVGAIPLYDIRDDGTILFGYAHFIYDMSKNVGVLTNAHPWGGPLIIHQFSSEVLILRYSRVPRDQAHRWGISLVKTAQRLGHNAAYAVDVEEVYGLTPKVDNSGFESSGITPFPERIPALLGTTLPWDSAGSWAYASTRGGSYPPYFIPQYQRRNKFPFVMEFEGGNIDPVKLKSYHLTLPKHYLLTYVDVAIKVQ